MLPARPDLTLFCELEPARLQALFAGGTVVDGLQALRASVSLGLLDLSPERAKVVQSLNRAGIPVVAWQLLPTEQGYWFNAGNGPQAVARYKDLCRWTATHGLRWAAVGLDIEPDISELRRVAAGDRRVLPVLVRRALDSERLRRAEKVYASLAGMIRADGYALDVYQLPVIVDERRAGSRLLRRVAGLVDVPADREVLMLYTSFVRPFGPAVLWSYGREARSIGIGSTGGGVQHEGALDVPPLTWEELARDLRLAARCTSDIHVFSLEGLAAQGFLQRLRDFDWQQPVSLPVREARAAGAIRGVFRAGFWASAHGRLVLCGLVLGVLLAARRRCVSAARWSESGVAQPVRHWW